MLTGPGQWVEVAATVICVHFPANRRQWLDENCCWDVLVGGRTVALSLLTRFESVNARAPPNTTFKLWSSRHCPKQELEHLTARLLPVSLGQGHRYRTAFREVPFEIHGNDGQPHSSFFCLLIRPFPIWPHGDARGSCCGIWNVGLDNWTFGGDAPGAQLVRLFLLAPRCLLVRPCFPFPIGLPSPAQVTFRHFQTAVVLPQAFFPLRT